MKYYEIKISFSESSDDARDIMAALAGESGCESFDYTNDGLLAYAQQSLFDEDALRSAIDNFPMEGIAISYQVREAEDRDWNEQWEQEGFEPITVGDRLVIHDGRHLPEAGTTAMQEAIISIEIDAHLAFGTGTHETTRMVCATLLDLPLDGKRVLDCGCGTGILGICALKLGAAECTAYDIDEWSADNTRHNAVINQVDDRLTVLCGDASVLDAIAADGATARSLAENSPAMFDVVVANINRNILLADMPRFRSVMAPGATLVLSGFYESDCTLLESKAQSLGLTLADSRHDGDWACMVFHS